MCPNIQKLYVEPANILYKDLEGQVAFRIATSQSAMLERPGPLHPYSPASSLLR